MSYGGSSYGGAPYAGAGVSTPPSRALAETNHAADSLAVRPSHERLAEGAATADRVGTPAHVARSITETNLAADGISTHVGPRGAIAETNHAADSLAVSHAILSAALAETNHAADSLFTGGPPSTAVLAAVSVVVASVAAASIPAPPAPAPGSTGFHDYQVIVTDMYGVAYGQINSAVPTEIEWELNGIGQALIDFWILDPSASVLPISCFPGAREIQIWRDGQLIWWGWPSGVTFDAKQVHLTCAGLLYPYSQRSFGPVTRNYLANPSFEEPVPFGEDVVPEWTPNGAVIANVIGTVPAVVPLATTPLLGNFMVQLVEASAGVNDYLGQLTPFITSTPIGLAFDLSAWVYIDPNTTFAPAFGQGGLFVQSIVDLTILDTELQQITADTPRGVWTRLETGISLPPNAVGVLDVRLYAPQGVTYWDACNLTVQESVGSPPGGADVQFIMEQIVTYAQDPVRGKSDLAMPFVGSFTGTTLIRDYQFFDNAGILDALNEFPTIGVCDFEVTWDATGHYRQFQIFSPAKGQVKYNYPFEIDLGSVTDLEGGIDGTQVATAVRFLGQGSSGSSEDIGYVAFPSMLGGRVAFDGHMTIDSNVITTDTAFFELSDIGKGFYCLTPGAIPVGTTIVDFVDSTEVAISNNNGGIASLTLDGATIGVGGIILDSVQSGLPDQPIGTLLGSAQGYLLRQLLAQFLPTSRQRADGPDGLFGNVETGDVVPVMFNYGWLSFGPVLMRIVNATLYPQTEELELQFNPVPLGQDEYV